MASCRKSTCRLWLWLVAGMILATGLSAGEIHVAAEQGDLAKVKALVAANPDCVNERDREQKLRCITRLMAANWRWQSF